MKSAQERQQLFADQAPAGVGIRAVRSELQTLGTTVGLGLRAPERQQGTDDAVLPLGLDALGVPARDEAVEHGLDLVRGRVTGRTEPVARERVTDAPQLILRTAAAAVDDLGAEGLTAETCVIVRLGSPQPVIHV